MKKIFSCFLFKAFVCLSPGQLLLEYDFNIDITASYADPRVVSSQFLGQPNFNSLPLHHIPFWGWDDQSFDVMGTQYSYGYFALAPADPLIHSLTLASLTFDITFNSGAVETGFEIYTSVDGFTTPIFVEPPQHTGGLVGTHTIDLTPHIPPNRVVPSTFRIVPYNSVYHDSTIFFLDNVAVYGVVNLIPEADFCHVLLLFLVLLISSRHLCSKGGKAQ